MTYGDVIKQVKKESHLDGTHMASYTAIEYMGKASILLIVFFLLRTFSIYFALAAIACALFILGKKPVGEIILAENTNSFEVLFEYILITLAIVFLAVGGGI